MNDREDKETVVQLEYHPYELLALGIILFAAIVELVWLWGKV